MKIIWLCNVILPSISNYLTGNTTVYGGWLDGLSKDIKNEKKITLNVVFPYGEEISGECDGITFFTFLRSSNANLKKQRFQTIIDKIKPDIIHIWGTEYAHSLDMTKVAMQNNIIDKTIVSIQGLISKCSVHYNANLPNKIINKYTFRDLIKRDNIAKQKKNFYKRGLAETEVIKTVKNVIGRTDWDRACTTQINPTINYHFCNETLRDSFYKEEKWHYDSCEKYSIFISQAGYPLKGFHYLLDALPIIKLQYPSVKVYVAGNKIVANKTIKEKLRISSYGKYIKDLIKKHDLTDNVVFLGNLSEEKMKERYLLSNVFVSASSIENSPNSVGEAMLLGVPVVSSDVGGVKNLLTHNHEGFIYQSDAPYMLAFYVSKIFDLDNKDMVIDMSKNAIAKAHDTHNKQQNLQAMIQIYNKIADKKYD